MAMLRKLGRLFTIKTRLEAWLVIYAIALGAVERGRLYLETYPGFGGWLLAAACTGVVFIAGAKLLDSVRPAEPAIVGGPYPAPARRRDVTGRSRPTLRPTRRASDYRFHVAQIDAGPGDRARALDIGADVERAVRILEVDRAARSRRRGATERLPVLRPGAPDRKVGETRRRSVDQGEVGRAGDRRGGGRERSDERAATSTHKRRP